MSMNFSEFKRLLGADPRNGDPGFLRARHSAPEFEQAAIEAERFEDLLDRAIDIPAPASLLNEILAIGQTPPETGQPSRWVPMALAATVLIAVGAAGMAWKWNRGWDSVEEYVVDHYRHDSDLALGGISVGKVQELFAGLSAQAAPALANIVGVIKYCPTPDGKGIHMILNTESGPVTVIYMPETRVTDREMFAFDNVEAILVDLQRGSAAIVGPDQQSISSLYAFVHDSILPAVDNS